jgi:hypothetical protein
MDHSRLKATEITTNITLHRTNITATASHNTTTNLKGTITSQGKGITIKITILGIKTTITPAIKPRTRTEHRRRATTRGRRRTGSQIIKTTSRRMEDKVIRSKPNIVARAMLTRPSRKSD